MIANFGKMHNVRMNHIGRRPGHRRLKEIEGWNRVNRVYHNNRIVFLFIKKGNRKNRLFSIGYDEKSSNVFEGVRAGGGEIGMGRAGG